MNDDVQRNHGIFRPKGCILITPPMSEKQKFEINLDNLMNVAHTGVRRAALFMGLGLNAAHRNDFNDYQLHKLPILPGQTGLPIDFFPPDLPIERVKEIKEAFAIWIIACGMRELLEHYAIFLDQIHHFCLVLFQKNNKLGSLNPQKAQTEFNASFGIPKKLDTLRTRFSLIPEDVGSIKSLYEARNALTHDLSTVLPKRCGADGVFRITWKTMDFFAKGDDTGIKRSIPELMTRATEEPTSLFAEVVLRERVLPVGSNITLSQQDLWEICFFFSSYAIPSTMQAFLRFLEAEGVKVKQT